MEDVLPVCMFQSVITLPTEGACVCLRSLAFPVIYTVYLMHHTSRLSKYVELTVLESLPLPLAACSAHLLLLLLLRAFFIFFLLELLLGV